MDRPLGPLTRLLAVLLALPVLVPALLPATAHADVPTLSPGSHPITLPTDAPATFRLARTATGSTLHVGLWYVGAGDSVGEGVRLTIGTTPDDTGCGSGAVFRPTIGEPAPLLHRITERYRTQHPVTVIEAVDCSVQAQPEALDQALVHLVQNAVEASGETSPVLLQARREGNEVVIEITDSGPGMTPEFVRSRLFRPFHSSKPGGFGIGAFEAREMVRAMGGRLEVESHEGLGSRFAVRLPLAAAAELIRTMRSTEDKVA